MANVAKRIVESRPFRGIIIAAILLAGILAGVETSASLIARYGALLNLLDATVIAIFVVEIVLKVAACGSRPLDYFRDGWNVFDFVIVGLCLLPVGGQFTAVLRLVRTLRLLRLITALPKLQLLVGALLKSLSGMGYVGLLLGLIFYIYAVLGIHLFGRQAPEHFGSLSVALMSLFQMITLDNWSDLFSSARENASVAATIYFVSFIMLGTMIMLNLFIGIVMNSMSEMHAELEVQRQAGEADLEKAALCGKVVTLDQQVAGLRAQLEEIRAKLSRIPS